MARRAKPANPNTTAPKLPLICAVEVTGFSEDGDVLARQIGTGSEVAALNIKFRENQRWGRRDTARGGPALGIGDRTLVRLTLEADGYRAEIVRRLEAPHRTVLGIYDGTGHIHPTGKSDRFGLMVDTAEDLGAEAGELVVAEVGSSRRAGLSKARIIEKLGTEPGSRVYSQIAIHAHSLPSVFSSAAMNEVATASAISTEGRADLREIPLVTIDSSNARDFDDAVWAEPVPDANGGGWSLIVAIADVAAYVAPGSALDVEAAERGNSVYLADRVIPMLPEALSNGWCSLKPGEDRACLTVHMHIDRAGTMREHRFERAIMRSAAKLTYAEVEAARSAQGQLPAPIQGLVLNLYGAFKALKAAAEERQTLNLAIPELNVILDADGQVISLGPAPKYDSHQLIEAFMIAANVAAAETLEKAGQPFLYRVHGEPPADKLEAFCDFINSLGIRMSKGQVPHASVFNRLIAKAKSLEDSNIVEAAVLRTQAQAIYTPSNIGHFGLGLKRYCHFTSPIRRYADLLLHRALIAGLKLTGGGGSGSENIDWLKLGATLGDRERRAAAAERDVNDRYAAAYYATNQTGNGSGQYSARISSVTRHGLFVTLDGTLAEGFVPKRLLPDDQYRLNKKARILAGRQRKLVYRIGDAVVCTIRDCDPLRGSLVLEVID